MSKCPTLSAQDCLAAHLDCLLCALGFSAPLTQSKCTKIAPYERTNGMWHGILIESLLQGAICVWLAEVIVAGLTYFVRMRASCLLCKSTKDEPDLSVDLYNKLWSKRRLHQVGNWRTINKKVAQGKKPNKQKISEHTQTHSLKFDRFLKKYHIQFRSLSMLNPPLHLTLQVYDNGIRSW